MARGTAFSELIVQLRNETGRSDDVNVGVDDLPALRQAINSVYMTLYDSNDWPHLRKFFDRIPLMAGERFYDFPDGLNLERVEQAMVWFNSKPCPLDRGIGVEEYAVYSSEDDERTDPVLRWDARWEDTAVQCEVWPVPVANDTQELQFVGIQAAPRLVNNTDLCLLDDTLVVLFAAAKLLGEKGGKIHLEMARERLKMLKARGRAGTRTQLGLGGASQGQPKIVVRVS